MTMTDELRAEIIAAIEAADLHSPEQVGDLVVDAAERGQDWRARLAECIRADVDTTYTLISCKGNKTVRCSSKAEAVAKAKQMEARLQPAFGVTVEDADGRTVASIFDGEDV